MDKIQKVSTAQFFSLLMLSRLLSTLTFMPVFDMNVNNSDYFPAIIIGSLILIVLLFPLFFIFKNSNSKGIIGMAYEVSPRISKTVCILYVLFFLFDAFSTLLRLELFVASAVFPDNDTTLFMLLTLAAVCYCATRGIEALGRAGSVCLAILIVSFAFVLAAMCKRVDINNLSPVFYEGAKPVLTVAWSVVIRTTEPVAIAVMLPKISGNVNKSIVLWTAFFSVFVSVLFFFLFTTSGNSALLNMFPIHSMAVLSEFGLIERLDGLLTGVWIISAFIKIAFVIFIIVDILSGTFEIKNKKVTVIASGCVLFAALTVSSSSISNFRFSSDTTVKSAVFLIFTVLIPMLLLIAEKIKKGKRT